MDALYRCLTYEFQDIPYTTINIKPTHTSKEGKNGKENI